MTRYETPLEKRLYLSRRHKERYATDADYRLRCVNRGRVAQGLRPRRSIEEIATYADGGRAALAKVGRDERGRFQ